MKKIPCVFVRKHIDLKTGEPFDERKKGTKYLAIDQVNPGCEWVLKGEGVAHLKYDGTPCMVINDGLGNRHLYQRYQGSNPPIDSIVCDVRKDNGKVIYWSPCDDKYIKRAFENALEDGDLLVGNYVTYEAIGPMINGNRQLRDEHTLIPHKRCEPIEKPTSLTFNGLKKYLDCLMGSYIGITAGDFFHEGLVFHHPDGRMAKIKRSDFNFE